MSQDTQAFRKKKGIAYSAAVVKSLIENVGTKIIFFGNVEEKLIDRAKKEFGRSSIKRCTTVDETIKIAERQFILVGDCDQIDGDRVNVSRILSVDVFQFLLDYSDDQFVVNNSRILRTINLDHENVYLFRGNVQLEKLVTEHNGVVVGECGEANVVVFNLPETVCELKQWINLRIALPTAMYYDAGKLKDILEKSSSFDVVQSQSEDMNMLTGITFLSNGLSPKARKKIENLGGEFAEGRVQNQVVVVAVEDGKDGWARSILLCIHPILKKEIIAISEKWLGECERKNSVVPLDGFEVEIPPCPVFHSLASLSGVRFSVSRTVLRLEAWRQLQERLKADIVEDPNESHAHIADFFPDESVKGEERIIRNINCLRHYEKHGAHGSCKYYHHSYKAEKTWRLEEGMQVVNIKAEPEEKEFVVGFLKTMGVGLTPRKEMDTSQKCVIFWDGETDVTAMEKALAIPSPLTYVSTRYIEALIAKGGERVQLKDYICHAKAAATKLKTQIKASEPKGQVEASPVRKRKKMEAKDSRNVAAWNPPAQGDKSEVQTRRLLANLTVDHLLAADIGLSVGVIVFQQRSFFPEITIPLEVTLTSSAMIKTLDAGVFNDFSTKYAQSINSPLVGGVFFARTKDSADGFADKVMSVLGGVFSSCSVSRTFLSTDFEGAVERRAMVIALGDRFRTLARVEVQEEREVALVDESVTRATPVKFWIPTDAVGVMMSGPVLPPPLANPQLNVFCSESCYCSTPLILEGVRVANFHDTPSMPGYAVEGTPLNLHRKSKFGGVLHFSANNERLEVMCLSAQEMRLKILELLKVSTAYSEIVGVGTLLCWECNAADGQRSGREEQQLTIHETPKGQLKCERCNKKCSVGMLVI